MWEKNFVKQVTRTLVVGAVLMTATILPIGATQMTVAGIKIDGDWQDAGGVKTLQGKVLLGNISLSDAKLTLEGEQLTGRANRVKVKLLNGCNLESGAADLGLTSGREVRQSLKNAPVKDSETYLFFDGAASASLDCFGLDLPLASGSKGRFFINPNDPSFYAQATQVKDGKTSDATSKAVRALVGAGIGKATVGVSKAGRIPWQSTEKNARGQRPTVNAHLVLGGDVEIKAGKMRVAVRDGSQALRLNLGAKRVDAVCVSGELFVPGAGVMVLGRVELPLGRGVACLDGSEINVSTILGGNAWDSLDFPKEFKELLDSFGNKPQKLSGTINGSSGLIDLSIPGRIPLGPWSVDGNLRIATVKLGLSGKTDFDLGPLDFGGVDVDAAFNKNGFRATGKGKATLGIDGAKLDSKFEMTESKLSGSADAKLWKVKVDGDFDFKGYKFEEIKLKGKVDAVVAGAKLKLKVTDDKVKTTATGSLLGKDFDVSVDSKGCFKVVGQKFCI